MELLDLISMVQLDFICITLKTRYCQKAALQKFIHLGYQFKIDTYFNNEQARGYGGKEKL